MEVLGDEANLAGENEDPTQNPNQDDENSADQVDIKVA